ncbi:hypothetical protein CLCR_01334 [Cladophialophora carrionii]|uniref:Uncharacterized protein n=1 Tax=Cladophialophora carrionii TaxID=86049 RepID=A0A1C1CCW0_9EURO|nr:hypothetical protein CLCR_01334 [Cladophialophora carrionii]
MAEQSPPSPAIVAEDSLSVPAPEAREVLRKCLFCGLWNPSRVTICDRCACITLPSRDAQQRRIKWTFHAFGPSAPFSKSITRSDFEAMLQRTESSENNAVYIGDEKRKVLLAHYPGGRRRFSTRTIDALGNVHTHTLELDSDNGSNRAIFNRAVNEIMDATGMTPGHKSLSPGLSSY